MSEQLALVPPEPPALTMRQQAALEYVAAHDGVPADEVGAHLHSLKERRPHPAGDRCDWCARDGLSVLRSKAVAPHVTYRRSSGGRLYILRGAERRSPVRTGRIDPATAEIPF